MKGSDGQTNVERLSATENEVTPSTTNEEGPTDNDEGLASSSSSSSSEEEEEEEEEEEDSDDPDKVWCICKQPHNDR